MLDLFILKNRVVVPVTSIREWGEFFMKPDRIVVVDQFGAVTVSTVFLGVNHRFGDGPPLVFETMVFGGPLNELQERCATWEEAEAQHERVCREVRALQ